MIRHFFTTVLFCTVTLAFVQAQKVDLDKRTLNIEYAGLPADPALVSLQSYAAAFNADPVTVDQLGLTPATINAYFKLEGYSYVTSKEDFTYSIAIEKPQVIKESVEEKKQEVKNADGSTKTIVRYIASVNIAIPTTITLKKNSDGSVLYTASFSTVLKPTVFTSGEQESKETAQTFINTKSKGLNLSIRDLYIKALQAEVNKLKQTYDFRKVTVTSLLWKVDVKKAPELSAFNVELEKAALILEKLSYKEPLEKARQDMAPVMQYWSDQAKSINASEKNLKKLKYGHLFNLAKSQYYLELFEECEKTCQLIIENDYDKADGRTISDDIKSVKESLTKTGLTSRHLKRQGFDSQAQFTYTPDPAAVAAATAANTPEKKTLTQKKDEFIQQNKQDAKDIKNSVTGIGKDIKKELTRTKITDTLNYSEARFSSVKLIKDGQLLELKEGDLGSGYAQPAEKQGIYAVVSAYDVSAFKKEGLFPIEKEWNFTGVNLRFFTNYKNGKPFTADSLIRLLKLYENSTLMDITLDSANMSFYGRGGATEPVMKDVWPKDYPKKLSADLRVFFHKDSEDSYCYSTKNGDAFTVKVLEVLPVIVNTAYDTAPKGYMLKLLIPEITLTRYVIGQLSSYRHETLTVKNIEMRVLISSAR